jgi:hypothetical protein
MEVRVANLSNLQVHIGDIARKAASTARTQIGVVAFLAYAVFILATAFLPFARVGYHFGSALSLYDVLANVDRINGSNDRVILGLVYASVLVPWVATNPRASITWALPLAFLAVVFWQAWHPLPQLLAHLNRGVLGTVSFRYGAYVAVVSAMVLAGIGLARSRAAPDRLRINA